MKLTEIREMHNREMKHVGLAKKTVDFYALSYRELEQFLGPEHPGVQDINNITRNDLYKLIGHLQDRGLKPGAVHAVMRGVRVILNWAENQELLEVNPMKKVKMPAVPRKLQEAVQPEIAAKVLALCDEDGRYKYRNRAIIALMYDTGLRLSEVAELELSDINFKNGTAFVQHGKGGHSRTVPIGNTVIRYLVKYLKVRNPKYPQEQKLWIGRDGVHFGKWGIIQLLDGYAVKLGISRSEIAPHAWRRGFAVQYLRNGGEMFALQQTLGHTNLEMTRKYVNYLTEDLKTAHTMISPLDRLSKRR